MGIKSRTPKAQFQPQNLLSLLESCGLPIFWVDTEYRFIGFNSEYARMVKELYGVDVELGVNLLEVMGDDGHMAKKNIDQALRGERVEQGGYIGSPESCRYFNVVHTPVLGEKGVVTGVATVLVDITPRVQLEERLQKEARRFEFMVAQNEAANDPKKNVFDVTLEAILALTQSQFGYIYFYSETTRLFTLCAYSEGVMEKYQPKEKQIIYELDKSGLWAEVVRERNPIRINDLRQGSLLRFLSVPIFEGDKIVAVAGVANKIEPYTSTDEKEMVLYLEEIWQIHKRQDAETHLRQLQSAVNSSPDSIVIADLHGNITFVNPKFTEVTGFTIEELLGEKHKILNAEALPAGFFEDIWKTLSAGKEWRGELTNTKKNGEVFWESTSISSVRDMAGKTVSYVAVKQDITQKRKMEEVVAQSKKLDSVGQLVAGVAHDFNNLLTSILAFNQMILRKSPQDSPANFFAQKIQLTGNRAADLVSSLLSIGRKQRLQEVRFNLRSFIETQEPLLQALDSLNLDLKLGTKDEEIGVMGDPSQISRVLMNLVSNARDAVFGQGQVTITCGKVDLTEIQQQLLGLTETGPHAYFSVSDDGPGMSLEIQKNVFEPFFTTKPIGKGTGIGLAVVLGIVKQHQGAIELVSAPGAGAQFTVYLPLV